MCIMLTNFACGSPFHCKPSQDWVEWEYQGGHYLYFYEFSNKFLVDYSNIITILQKSCTLYACHCCTSHTSCPILVCINNYIPILYRITLSSWLYACVYMYDVYKHVFICILYKGSYIMIRFYNSFQDCQKELWFRVVAEL